MDFEASLRLMTLAHVLNEEVTVLTCCQTPSQTFYRGTVKKKKISVPKLHMSFVGEGENHSGGGIFHHILSILSCFIRALCCCEIDSDYFQN